MSFGSIRQLDAPDRARHQTYSPIRDPTETRETNRSPHRIRSVGTARTPRSAEGRRGARACRVCQPTRLARARGPIVNGKGYGGRGGGRPLLGPVCSSGDDAHPDASKWVSGRPPPPPSASASAARAAPSARHAWRASMATVGGFGCQSVPGPDR